MGGSREEGRGGKVAERREAKQQKSKHKLGFKRFKERVKKFLNERR